MTNVGEVGEIMTGVEERTAEGKAMVEVNLKGTKRVILGYDSSVSYNLSGNRSRVLLVKHPQRHKIYT